MLPYIFLFLQGSGLLVTEDNTCYEGEFTGGPNLYGKVWNVWLNDFIPVNQALFVISCCLRGFSIVPNCNYRVN